jgi:hypothetical protein
MVFLKKNSLRSRVDSHTRANHSMLFKNSWRNTLDFFYDEISSSSGWLYILGFITTMFLLTLIVNINAINIIPLTPDTAQKIVDQRASNIATIMSITLAVVGFLLANIAVKESFSYQLLFKRSLFYPVVYLTLSTIAYFIIVSTLRNTLDDLRFAKLVLFGTYLALSILVLIGFLFRKIIQFTDGSQIIKLLHEEVMSEAVTNLKLILFRKYSRELYKRQLEGAGAIEYNLSEALGNIDLSSVSYVSNNIEQKEASSIKYTSKRLHDINIKKVVDYVLSKKSSGKIYYKAVTLDEVYVTPSEDFVWISGVVTPPNERESIDDALVLRSKLKPNSTINTARGYLDQKLSEWSADGKSERLEQLLNTYRELYELESKHLK